jgi:hypothetical protein
MWCHVVWLMYFVSISSILKLQEAGAHEILLPIYQSTRCHTQDDPNINMYICDKLFTTQFLG